MTRSKHSCNLNQPGLALPNHPFLQLALLLPIPNHPFLQLEVLTLIPNKLFLQVSFEHLKPADSLSK